MQFWPTRRRPPRRRRAARPHPRSGPRSHFGLIDALLPIIAVILVVIVVLSWLG